MNNTIEELVSKIYRLNSENSSVMGWDEQQSLGDPANEETILFIEQKFSFKLPGDYREFLLSCCDGWVGFEGELDLLSTAQMLDKSISDNILDISLEAGGEESVVKHGFVIQASATSPIVVFFDRLKSPSIINPELVYWEYGEINRFPSFLEYLKYMLNISEKTLLLSKQRMGLS